MGQTVTSDTGAQLFIDSDVSKIFVGSNKYEKGNLANGTGAELTIPAGTLIGRISATSKLAIMKSASTDGSKTPIGVLAHDVVIATAGNADLTFCNKGEVVESKLVFDGSDTISDEVVISAASNIKTTYNDLINDLGIVLVDSIEMTNFDNQ